MNATLETDTQLHSAVADMRHVPLSELVRTREAQLNRALANASEFDATSGEFNSSI